MCSNLDINIEYSSAMKGKLKLKLEKWKLPKLWQINLWQMLSIEDQITSSLETSKHLETSDLNRNLGIQSHLSKLSSSATSNYA